MGTPPLTFCFNQNENQIGQLRQKILSDFPYKSAEHSPFYHKRLNQLINL